MVNRQTGLICNFYTDTENGIENVLELIIRGGFRRIGESNGVSHEFGMFQARISYAELEGAKIFKKRFGKKRTKREALDLIKEMKLAKDGKEAEKILNYMVENDIPYRMKLLFIFDEWNNFTIVPNREGTVYGINKYPPTLGELFQVWKAATYE